MFIHSFTQLFSYLMSLYNVSSTMTGRVDTKTVPVLKEILATYRAQKRRQIVQKRALGYNRRSILNYEDVWAQALKIIPSVMVFTGGFFIHFEK